MTASSAPGAVARRGSRERHRILHLAGAVVVGVMVLPLLYLLFRGAELVTLGQAEALIRPATGWALIRSVLLAGGVATLCVAIALPLAWWTHATDLPQRRFLRMALVLPLAVPSYVAAFAVLGAFGPGGALGRAWAWLGVPPPEILGAPGAVLALLFCYPLALLPLQAALSRMDPALWEAGRSLGRSPRAVFREVILPQLRPAIGVGWLLVALYVLGDFGAVSLLGFESLSMLIYVRYQQPFEREEAILLALLLVVLSLGLMWLQRRLAGTATSSPTRGGARPWPRIGLGAWRWPAWGISVGVLVFGLGLPLLVVGTWLWHGFGPGVGSLSTEAANTLGVGVIAAVVTVLVAAVPVLLVRHGGPLTQRVMSASSHVGYALPGIVVALALVFFAIRFGGPLYQTVVMLLLAYLVRFLPLAFGTLSEGMQAQDPRLYEAARTLGCGPWGAWARVVWPALSPALMAALVAVFVAVIKELPATLLLKPIGFHTLATRIWSLTEDGAYSAASLPVLLLLVLAGLLLVLRPDARVRA